MVACFFVGRKLEVQKNWERREMQIIHLFYAHEFRICDKNWSLGQGELLFDMKVICDVCSLLCNKAWDSSKELWV